MKRPRKDETGFIVAFVMLAILGGALGHQAVHKGTDLGNRVWSLFK